MPAKTKLRYISLFSGIEAWSCAVKNMPEYEPVAFCEIDPFASAVLAHHYPNVPNLGDITKVDWSKYNGLVDLVVGGSPCQGFSIAGLRKGLQDDRSCLALAYVKAIEAIKPRWFVFENVPAILSCNNGDDIKQFFAALDECGYSISWAVLDSQYFSLAQRRRRLFACGYFGGWERSAKVFFEQSCLQRHPPARRQAREGDPAGIEAGAGNRGVSGTLCASGAGLDRPSASGNQLDYLITHTHTLQQAYQIDKGAAKPAIVSNTLDIRSRNGPMQNQTALAILSTLKASITTAAAVALESEPMETPPTHCEQTTPAQSAQKKTPNTHV